jgi:uncharacterized membrane protein (UPF0127 family)
MEVFNTTRGVVLVQDVEVAFDFWKRFKGLLGRRSFPVGAGLLLKPCNSVHSCFMAFPFDVLFLIRLLIIITGSPLLQMFLRGRMTPFTMPIPIIPRFLTVQ